MSINDIAFSRMKTSGNNYYRKKEEPAEIEFINNKTGVRKLIVDNDGFIVDFPGIEHPKVVKQFSNGPIGNRINYISEIMLVDGQYALIWQIQPDGKYWADDSGFGSNNDVSLYLYARLDESGRYIEKFKIFSIGSVKVYEDNIEDRLAKHLESDKEPVEFLKNCPPEIMPALIETLNALKPGRVEIGIPGTLYESNVGVTRLNREEWMLYANMKKYFSPQSLDIYIKKLPLDEMKEYLASNQVKELVEEALIDLYYKMERKKSFHQIKMCELLFN